MPFHFNKKIDLTEEYPCPCRRKGILKTIVLTEAMGCELCQQIFVLTESATEIEQLSSVYPYKRRWRWSGKRWIAKGMWGLEIYFPLILWTVLVMLVTSIPILIKYSEGFNIFLAIVLTLVLILLSFLLWLSYQRY